MVEYIKTKETLGNREVDVACARVLGYLEPFMNRPVPCPSGDVGRAVPHLDVFSANGIRIPAFSTDPACVPPLLATVPHGGGFDQATSGARTGHGLSNMRTRASELGGDLRVESAPGKGTRILLLLPVASLA